MSIALHSPAIVTYEEPEQFLEQNDYIKIFQASLACIESLKRKNKYNSMWMGRLEEPSKKLSEIVNLVGYPEKSQKAFHDCVEKLVVDLCENNETNVEPHVNAISIFSQALQTGKISNAQVESMSKALVQTEALGSMENVPKMLETLMSNLNNTMSIITSSNINSEDKQTVITELLQIHKDNMKVLKTFAETQNKTINDTINNQHQVEVSLTGAKNLNRLFATLESKNVMYIILGTFLCILTLLLILTVFGQKGFDLVARPFKWIENVGSTFTNGVVCLYDPNSTRCRPSGLNIDGTHHSTPQEQERENKRNLQKQMFVLLGIVSSLEDELKYFMLQIKL